MRLLCFLLAYLPFSSSYAQHQEDAVLMTLDGTPVYAKEFKQVYRKNLNLVDENAQQDIDAYLELFKNYKLKLAAAEALGLDERENLQQELQTYKDQLARAYIEDAPVTEKLINEAYAHTRQEVKASHIMIRLEEHSSPEDTLAAYQRMKRIKEEIAGGADFETVARRDSEDPSVKENGGDVGWFNAFKMVYPFEKAAFDTPIDSISEIIRSQFGYHILKTTGKRESRGKVEVAHIMLAFKKDAEVNDQERRILAIYDTLQAGASFDLLARKYSDDKRSAMRGGGLEPFAAGSLSSPVFEEKAFALKDTGAISQPFKSNLGWHIVKLKKKFPIKSLEELKLELIRAIEQDSRSKLVEEALQEKLENELKVSENDEILNEIQRNNQDADFLNSDKTLLVIKGDTITLREFYNYLTEEQNSPNARRSRQQQTAQVYDSFKSEKLMQYFQQQLEETNDEYRQITQEYRDGILLFALMEEKIWNVAREDTVGLKRFFEEHREDYQSETQYNITLVNSPKKSTAQKARRLMQSGSKIEEVAERFRKNGSTMNTSTAIVGEDDSLYAKVQELDGNFSEVYRDAEGYTFIIKNNMIESATMDMNAIKGQVMSDYQDHIEQTWLSELREKHNLKVDEQVYDKLKKELSR